MRRLQVLHGGAPLQGQVCCVQRVQRGGQPRVPEALCQDRTAHLPVELAAVPASDMAHLIGDLSYQVHQPEQGRLGGRIGPG